MIRQMMTAITLAGVLAGTAWAEDPNPVLGRAGDVVIREADLERIVSKQAPAVRDQLLGDRSRRDEAVRQILMTRVVAAKARKEGFDRKPETREQLSYLVDQFLAQEYLASRAEAVQVPEEQVKAYYRDHTSEFQIDESVKARHIFVEAAAAASAEVKERARLKVAQLLKELKEGKDFAGLARERSEDETTAPKGGEIGYISHGKSNSEEFEKAVFALKAGELSEIVTTPFGYHIIRVDERREKRSATFEEARGYIAQRLKSEAAQKTTQEFLDALVKESGLEIVGAGTKAGAEAGTPKQ